MNQDLRQIFGGGNDLPEQRQFMMLSLSTRAAAQ
jgi:hypothetical protein